ncbi:MAG: hypothetical protein IKN63_04375 [Bacilli bacterium]|nr:hypothetical protein [Bacilli bacterium]
MKIENDDNLIIIYLINTFYSSLDKKELINEIKKIFIRLTNYYNYELKGIYDVNLYENIKYGTILEIINKDELLFRRDYIDINLKIYKNNEFYFKTNDYFIISKFSNIYYYKGYYYMNINNIDNYLYIIEHGMILYKEKDNYLSKMKYIK